LAFDGTRIKASNHRHRSLTPDKLQARPGPALTG
jgi:hypothetical protein